MINFNDLSVDDIEAFRRHQFEYEPDAAERDQMWGQSSAMLRFYDHMIVELEQLGGQMADFGMTHQIGLFLLNSASMHRHTYEWCQRVLQERCPPSDEVPEYVLWVTAYRLLRRHVACWQKNPDYQETWNPEADPYAQG